MSAAYELPALVDVEEVAVQLDLHPDHVRRLVRRGELVGYRLGRWSWRAASRPDRMNGTHRSRAPATPAVRFRTSPEMHDAPGR